MSQAIHWFHEVGLDRIAQIGGKNASLGELITHLATAGVRVPGGFATSADAYVLFLKQNQLDSKIETKLATLNVEDIQSLAETGNQIRQWILAAELPASLITEVSNAYQTLLQREGQDISVAIRSSATAEDLPEASFAGQQETFLNVRGIDNVLLAIKQVYASLFTDRAIAYRQHQGFPHQEVNISVGVQRMVRSDLAASGVMFTLDTESGFDDAIFITGAYGLGECVVQGRVNPDEFYVYKPNATANKPSMLRKTMGSKSEKMIFADDGVAIIDVPSTEQTGFCINDDDVFRLAQLALKIEAHYDRPMDIEWAKMGLMEKFISSKPVQKQ